MDIEHDFCSVIYEFVLMRELCSAISRYREYSRDAMSSSCLFCMISLSTYVGIITYLRGSQMPNVA